MADTKFVNKRKLLKRGRVTYYNLDYSVELCCVCGKDTGFSTGIIQDELYVDAIYTSQYDDYIIDKTLYIICSKECRSLFELTPECYVES